jgi:hypothetical protein
MGMLQRLLRSPRAEVEVGVGVGCLVPLAAVLAIAIGVGVMIGTRLQPIDQAPREAIVRVIDDGAKPGPKVLTTQVVPLR